jgi:acetylornithine/N-succinyldiaminopimelate aminotransferase
MKSTHLLDHVTEIGGYFAARLEALKTTHPSIVAIRGRGLMIGVELNSDTLAKEVLAGMMERRILINRTHETVLRFLPPYLITREHVDQTITALHDLLVQHTRSTAPVLTAKS